MAYPCGLIPEQRFVGAVLIRVILTFEISAVTPRYIEIHQCPVVLFQMFRHPDAAHFFDGLL